MNVVQVLRIEHICIALQLHLLLLLPLPLLHASPCPTTEEINVTNSSDAENLAEALLCDGSGNFAVTWHGTVMLSRTLSVSNGSTLNVTGSTKSTGAAISGDGTILLIEVDLASTVSLTGLTLSGGDGALHVTEKSFIEVIDCSFVRNNRTSSSYGGAIFADGSTVVLKGETVFANNTADDGGAIHLTEESGELNVMEGGSAYFVNNYAADYGGAIRIRRQSVFNIYGNASFASNEAGYGGAVILYYLGVFNNYGTASFVSNTGLGGGALRVVESAFNSYGTASFVSNEASEGGAVLIGRSNVWFGGETVFDNNTAEENGGALYIISGSNVSVGGETMFTIITAGDGGAIDIVVDSSASFGGETMFTNNTAQIGGAVYSSDSLIFVETGTRFMLNVASTGSGGGVYASKSVISLNNAEFTGNRGAWGGGVALFSSGSMWDEETGGLGPSNITGCSFEDNEATDGGAIYTAAGYDMVVNSSFTRNFAAVQGGALLHNGVLVALIGCTFVSNMAGEDGIAVMSLGIAENISASSFQNNSFFCASGEYGFTEDSDLVEDSDTCRWDVVCSRCTDPQCDVPAGIDINETTVPLCEEVPEGVNTTGNSGMTLETLDLMSGFYRTSNKSREVLECYRDEACLGGSNADTYCAEGYAGPYCATCDEGYASGYQYSCHSCQGSDKRAAIGGAVAVLVVTTLAVALVLGYLVGDVERAIPERRGNWERRALNFRDRLVRAIPLTAIKIVLVSWQIITQFSGVVNAQYPTAYENFLATLSVVNLNLGSILSLSCVVETNFYARLVLATIAPIVVLGVLVITYRVAVIRNNHSIHAMRVVWNKHLALGLFLIFAVYSSVSYTIFQTFVCDSLDSGVTYIRADYDLVCWTRAHVGYMTYAGFMILVYPVGIPAVFAWVLYVNREGIKSVEGTNKSLIPPETEAIKDLWAPYKRSRYYYEIIECGRRIALTGLAVFIYPGSTAQVAIEALLAIVFYSISEILSPFTESLDAWLYRSGTWVIYLSMYLALLLEMDTADEDNHSQDVFAGLLIAAHGGMILVVTANTLLSALKGFREVRTIETPVRVQDPTVPAMKEDGFEHLEEGYNDASK